MTSYQIDNVILAAHCILHCTVQCFSVSLDSGSGQCSRYSVGFPCFSHHRLHLSVSQYIADDTCSLQENTHMVSFTIALCLFLSSSILASFLTMLHIMAHYKIPNLSGVP